MQARRTLGTQLAGVLTIATLAVATPSVWAQGSGSSRTNPPQQPRRPQTIDEFARDFWQFIHKPQAPYTTWKIADTSTEAAEATPHGAASRTFLNSISAADIKGLPHGSIIINESVTPDQKVVTTVTVMYRVRGADPANLDWYWIQYLPDGTLARADSQSGGRPLAGRVGSCVECHRKAQGNDLVFFNDVSGQPDGSQPGD